MQSIKITEKILFHIGLDGEENGRNDFSGCSELYIYGYLRQFILKEFSGFTKYRACLSVLDNLITHSNDIMCIDNSASTADDLNTLCNRYCHEILNLSENNQFSFPAGWINLQGSTHSIIFQFAKVGTDINFYVYNSGAGISYHELVSRDDRDEYSPIMIFTLGNPRSKLELQNLIKHLILPYLVYHPDHLKSKNYSEKDIYETITRGMIALKAERKPAKSIFNRNLSTPGIVSGICVQGTVQQMLKVHIGDIGEYRHFLLKYRLHALEDFLNTYEAPYQVSIHELLILYIQKSLKIAKSYEESNDILPSHITSRFIVIHQQLLSQEVIPDEKQLLLSDKDPKVDNSVINNTDCHQLLISSDKQVKILPPLLHVSFDNILGDLQNILSNIRENNSNSFWITQQIEQVVLELPLPILSGTAKSATFARDDYYESLQDHQKINLVTEILYELQDLYVKHIVLQYGNTEKPRPVIVQCSFLALQSYFDHKYCSITKETSMLPIINYFMGLFLLGYKNHYPATFSPNFDRRLNYLLKNYHYFNLNAELEIIDYFKRWIDSKDGAITKLNKLYNNYYSHERDIFHAQIANNNQSVLFCFFKGLESFKEHKEMVEDKFVEISELLTLGQRIIKLEECIFNSLMMHDVKPIQENLPGFYISYSLGRSPSLHLYCNSLTLQRTLVDNNRQLVIRDIKSNAVSNSDLKDLLHTESTIYRHVLNSEQTKPNANDIELAWQNDSKKTHKTQMLMTRLLHLRSSENFQPKLTIAYFNIMLTRVLNDCISEYIELNLFEPMVIFTIFNQEDPFKTRFNIWIDEGIQRVSTNEQFSAAAIQYLRLRFYFNQYAARFSRENLPLLSDFQEYLTTRIEKQQDPNVLCELHKYRFLVIMVRYSLNESDINLFKDAYCSYVAVQQTKTHFFNENLAAEWVRAELDLKSWMYKLYDTSSADLESSQLDDIIQTVIQEIIPENTTLVRSRSDTFRWYEVVNPVTKQILLTVDAATGLIYKDGKASISIPFELIYGDFYGKQQIPLKASSWFVYEDGITFECEHAGSTMFVRKVGTRVVIQKLWFGEWFELDFYNNYLSPQVSQLPGFGVVDAGWVKLENKTILFTNKDTPVFIVNSKGDIKQLSTSAEKILFFDYPPREILSFDVPSYIYITQSVNEKLINFSRYPLKLRYREDGSIYFEKTDYKLRSLGLAPFSPIVSCLLFEREHKHKRQRFVIVPIRPFYSDSGNTVDAGVYYPLRHDVVNKKEVIGSYVTYRLIDNKPKPSSCADAIYLCYIYLATHKLDLALELIEDINNSVSFTASEDELLMIYWIIAKLPAADKDNKESESSALNTPRYITCKLKIIAIFTQWTQRGNRLIWSDKFNNKSNSSIAEEQKDIVEFYNILQPLIEGLYLKWNKVKYDPEKKYQLTDSERLSLLNYIFTESEKKSDSLLSSCFQQQINNIEFTESLFGSSFISNNLISLFTNTGYYKPPSGVLAYERSLLQTQQYVEFEKIAIPGNPLITRFAQYTAEVRDQIGKNAYRIRTEIRSINYTVNMPKKIPYVTEEEYPVTYGQWCEFYYANLHDLSHSSVEAMQAFTTVISLEDLMRYYPNYVAIALSDQNNTVMKQLFYFQTPEEKLLAKQKEALMAVCDVLLRSYVSYFRRKHDVNKQRVMPYMINVLYLLCIHSRTIPKHDERYLRFDYLYNLCITLTPHIFRDVQVSDNYLSDAFAFHYSILENAKSVSSLDDNDRLLDYVPSQNVSKWTPLELLSSTDDTLDIKILVDFYYEYQRIEKSFTEQLEEFSTLESDSKEAMAGTLLYNWSESKHKLAKMTFANSETVANLQKQAQEFLNSINVQLDESWSQAVSFANRIPDNPRDAYVYKRNLAAGIQYPATIVTLQRLYQKRSTLAYQNQTTCKTQSVVEYLHGLVSEIMVLEIKRQQLERIISAIELKVENNELAEIICSQLLDDCKINPTFMLFQYQNNLLIRQKQLRILKDLAFASKNTIKKMIMGDGKSRVVRQLLMEVLSDKNKLIVSVVPRSLLIPTHKDMQFASFRLSNKKGFLFEFDRSSDITPNRLRELFYHLLFVMRNNHYLVSTVESFEALQLVYIELLLHNSDSAEYSQQVRYLEDILVLLQESGVAVLDELNECLAFKRKLNHPLGLGSNIQYEYIRHSVELFTFITNLTGLPLESIRQDCIERRWQQLLPHLANELLNNENSPIYEDIKMLDKAELLVFMTSTDTNTTYPDFANLSEFTKDKLSFYREQLHLLPKTLLRRYNAEYGYTKLINLTPLQKSLAIPYDANSKPKEKSRFRNILETINYTVQAMLINGVQKSLLEKILNAWQVDCARENFENGHLDSSLNKKFNLFLQPIGYTIQTLNLEDQNCIDTIFFALRYDKNFIFEALNTWVLPQIKIDSDYLHSNALNFVQMFSRVLGFSGSLGNAPSFDVSFDCDTKVSIGSDDYILKVLNQKDTQVHSVAAQEFSRLLLHFEEKLQISQHLHAVIDTCARFTELAQIDVARELARFFSTRNPTIKYVLYFDEKDKLCAINTSEPFESISAGTLTDAKSICEELDCTISEYVTYYAQDKTFGMDITQDRNSSALVFVDDKDLERLLQGITRMRGYDKNQRIILVTPEDYGDIKLEELTANMANNGRNTLKQQMTEVTVAQLANIFRSDILRRAYELPNLKDKISLIKHCRRHFVCSEKERSLFELYGKPYEFNHTIGYYYNQISILVDLWKEDLLRANQVVTEQMLGNMNSLMIKIVNKLLPHSCQSIVIRNNTQTYGSEVQLTQENIFELQQQVYVQPKTLTPRPYVGWRKAKRYSLQHVNYIFSDTLYASENYAFVHIDQYDINDFHLKPVDIICFTYDKGSLSACLITTQEADEMAACLGLESTMWISSIDTTVIAGVCPDGIHMHDNYKAIMEQVHFINGSINEWIEYSNPSKFQWLADDYVNKMRYYESNIMPYRETTIRKEVIDSIVMRKTNTSALMQLSIFGVTNTKSYLQETHEVFCLVRR